MLGLVKPLPSPYLGFEQNYCIRYKNYSLREGEKSQQKAISYVMRVIVTNASVGTSFIVCCYYNMKSNPTKI